MDKEIQAMSDVASAMEELTQDERNRVLKWAFDRYSNDMTIPTKAKGNSSFNSSSDSQNNDENLEEEIDEQDTTQEFETFAEFYAKAQPKTHSEKVLVAGYWFQVIKENRELTSAPLNKELKHLGHGITNISEKFDSLKSAKPQLAIQLRKSGKSKQARKKYKITDAGKKKVQSMLSSNS